MTPEGPLLGLRAVELASAGPGPYAAMMLADLGADVVRVDRPPAGRGGIPAAFDLLNRGRRSVIIDLRATRGAEVVLRLAERADVLVEGFRPGVAERLGVGPAECLSRNPRLVYTRVTGWGQTGPKAATAGHDIGYIARTGALHSIGSDARPWPPLNLVGDFAGGGMLAVIGILAAVLEARASGTGQVIDVAMVDGVSSLMTATFGMRAAGMWHDARASNILDGGAPHYEVYETADGRWMAVGAIEAHFFAELLKTLGIDADPAERFTTNGAATLRARMTEAFKSRTRDEWTAAFDGSDACAEPVKSLDEAPLDEHLAARETFVAVDGVAQPAPAPRFSRTPARIQSPPPAAGAHTRCALRDWGICDIEELIDGGVAVQR
jgi:alpha-methylacyl-CoA racemase